MGNEKDLGLITSQVTKMLGFRFLDSNFSLDLLVDLGQETYLPALFPHHKAGTIKTSKSVM